MAEYYNAVWYRWCDTSSTAASNADLAWTTWSGTTSNCAGDCTGGTANVWVQWTSGDSTGDVITCNGTGPYIDARTEEERAADEARWAAERLETERRANEAAAVRAAARDKARTLLVAMLNEQQRAQLQRERFFEVIAKHSKRRYRIHEGTHGNVRLLSEDGREVTRYCGQPNGVPTEDAMLAQKLQIEHDEDTFLQKANATRLTA